MNGYPEYFKDVANNLPEDQREEALYRMQKAHIDGVEHIGLWDSCDKDGAFLPLDISDLVGNCERKREELRAKGDFFSSGLIFLDKYKNV